MQAAKREVHSVYITSSTTSHYSGWVKRQVYEVNTQVKLRSKFGNVAKSPYVLCHNCQLPSDIYATKYKPFPPRMSFILKLNPPYPSAQAAASLLLSADSTPGIA